MFLPRQDGGKVAGTVGQCNKQPVVVCIDLLTAFSTRDGRRQLLMTPNVEICIQQL